MGIGTILIVRSTHMVIHSINYFVAYPFAVYSQLLYYFIENCQTANPQTRTFGSTGITFDLNL